MREIFLFDLLNESCRRGYRIPCDVGIVNAKIVDESVENIGYAIPSVIATAVADNIIDHCYGKDTKTVMRAVLGITLGTTSSGAVFDEETGTLKIVETVCAIAVSRALLLSSALEGVTTAAFFFSAIIYILQYM